MNNKIEIYNSDTNQNEEFYIYSTLSFDEKRNVVLVYKKDNQDEIMPFFYDEKNNSLAVLNDLEFEKLEQILENEDNYED